MNLPLSPFYFPFYVACYPLSTMASNDPSLPVPHTMESKPPDQVSPTTPLELHSVPPPAPAPPPQPCPPPQTPRGLAPGLHADPGSGLQGQSSPDLYCYSGGDSLGRPLASALGPHVRQLLCYQSMDPDFVRVLRDDFTHNFDHMDAPQDPGHPQLPLGWLSVGSSLQCDESDNKANPPNPMQSDDAGAGGTLPPTSTQQYLQQAEAPATRALREP